MQGKVGSAMTYGSAGVTLYLGKYTLNDIALFVGIGATVITLAMNLWFQWRRDRREELALKKHAGGEQ